MEGIDQWAITVSVCAVVVCITELLISDTSLEKTVRLVLGAFMLCAVLFPLGDVILDFSAENYFNEQSLTILPNDIDSLREKYLNKQISSLIENTLASHDISPSKISVTTDIDESNSINGISAEISLHKTDAKKAPEISRLLKDELGIECRTIITG